MGKVLLALVVALALCKSPLLWAGSDPCSDPSSLQNVTDCQYEELEQADQALNQAYQNALKRIRRQDTGVVMAQGMVEQSFRSAQRAWLVWRDEECAFEGMSTYAVSAWQSIHSIGCKTRVTGERVKHFDSIFPELGPATVLEGDIEGAWRRSTAYEGQVHTLELVLRRSGNTVFGTWGDGGTGRYWGGCMRGRVVEDTVVDVVVCHEGGTTGSGAGPECPTYGPDGVRFELKNDLLNWHLYNEVSGEWYEYAVLKRDKEPEPWSWPEDCGESVP